VSVLPERGLSPFREGGSFRVCLVYPNTRSVGACNLGFATLFRLFNEHADCTAERCFALADGTRSVPERPRTIETERYPDEFAALAFTFMSEVDYLNGVRFLKACGIAWRRRERSAEQPLIIVGGAAPTLNPAPILSFADVVVRGEAEDAFPDALATLIDAWHGGGKAGAMTALTSLSNWEDAQGCAIGHLPPVRNPMAHLDLVSHDSAFSEMALVEATRGCPWHCSFCAACRLYAPYRAAPLEPIVAYAKSMAPFSTRVGLVGAGLAARSDLCELMDAISELDLQVSLSSLRLDRIDQNLLTRMRAHGQRTITVAPESMGKAALELLDKRLSLDQIASGLEILCGAGFSSVKVYMIIGIPGVDWRESAEAAERLLSGLGRLARRIHVACSILQPKPGTPLARADLVSSSDLKKEVRYLRSKIGRIVGSIELPKRRHALLADLLCRGGLDALELALDGKAGKAEHWASVETGANWWWTGSSHCN